MYKQMKFRIGDDPGLRVKIQKILFDVGALWPKSGQTVKDVKYIFLGRDGYLGYSLNEDVFNASDYLEIDIDWMRTPEPEPVRETVTIGSTTYYTDDVNKALAGVEPICSVTAAPEPQKDLVKISDINAAIAFFNAFSDAFPTINKVRESMGVKRTPGNKQGDES